jgi:hypothetical protein
MPAIPTLRSRDRGDTPRESSNSRLMASTAMIMVVLSRRRIASNSCSACTDPTSAPRDTAVDRHLTRAAASAMPRFRPCPARGCVVWQASLPGTTGSSKSHNVHALRRHGERQPLQNKSKHTRRGRAKPQQNKHAPYQGHTGTHVSVCQRKPQGKRGSRPHTGLNVGRVPEGAVSRRHRIQSPGRGDRQGPHARRQEISSTMVGGRLLAKNHTNNGQGVRSSRQ